MRILLAFGLLFLSASGTQQEPDLLDCDDKNSALVRYRLQFKGKWTEEDFPKQYPKFRPPAQWSKLIGRVHSEDYKLWTKGDVVSGGFKDFAQEGKTEELEKRESQGYNGLLDAFVASPVKAGEGETSADFFTDYNHSLVSTATKVVPSPDWFVGVDSLNLCKGGKWQESVTVPLDPLDAGTDQGFTFTSPNWASRPAQPVLRITSKFPNHAANSFYNPTLDELPEMASISFQLLSIYGQESVHQEVSHWKEFSEVDREALEKRREKLEQKRILAGEPVNSGRHLLIPFKVHQRDRGDQKPLLKKESKLRQDCIVGDWAAWTSCSKTCGFGAQKRHRKVLQIPKHGLPCPLLDQQKWCGSMRRCRDEKKMFSWLDKGGKRSRQVHVRRRQSRN